MVVNKNLKWKYVISFNPFYFFFFLGYTLLICYARLEFNIDLSTSVSVPAILGTALSIFLAFRTNSAYDRWWEARKVWGSILNDSRTHARQIMSLIENKNKEGDSSLLKQTQKQLIDRQIGWSYSLAQSLRKLDPFKGLDKYFSSAELTELKKQKNVPNAILQLQAQHLKELQMEGQIDRFALLKMDETLSRLTDFMGMAERIKNTIFPPLYSRFAMLLLWFFNLLIPMALVDEIHYFAIPVSLLIGFIFYVLEELGFKLENPFENQITDTPMSAICQTIEINLLQQLGETKVPEMPKPVNGVLM